MQSAGLFQRQPSLSAACRLIDCHRGSRPRKHAHIATAGTLKSHNISPPARCKCVMVNSIPLRLRKAHTVEVSVDQFEAVNGIRKVTFVTVTKEFERSGNRPRGSMREPEAQALDSVVEEFDEVLPIRLRNCKEEMSAR